MKWLLALFMMMMPLAVSAQAVPKLVPDVSQANSFLIETARPGVEQVYCALTQKPLQSRVPAALTEAKLSPIKDMASLEALQKTIAAQLELLTNANQKNIYQILTQSIQDEQRL